MRKINTRQEFTVFCGVLRCKEMQNPTPKEIPTIREILIEHIQTEDELSLRGFDVVDILQLWLDNHPEYDGFEDSNDCGCSGGADDELLPCDEDFQDCTARRREKCEL